MTVGVAASQANSLLDTLLNSTFVQLHTADPGAAGTTGTSTVTGTRPAATYNAAAAGSKALTSAVTWGAWAGTNNEVVTHISFWTANTAGTFKASMVLTTPKTMGTGDVLNLNTATMTLTPIAA